MIHQPPERRSLPPRRRLSDIRANMTAATALARALTLLRPSQAVAARPGGVLRAGMKLAVVQPLPGIGDMIWHLPHLRALSAACGQPVTLVTKRGSLADQLLAAEPSVGDFIWLRGNTSGHRGLGAMLADQLRLAGELRAGRFDAIVLLHHSATLAAVAALAGIPLRFGYGEGAQRLLLNRPPFLAAADLRAHPYRQASAWIAAAGLALPDAEPVLAVTPAAASAVQARLGGGALPVVLGIGSSEPYKQWGAERFAELAARLRRRGWSDPVLLGGPAEAGLAAEIQARLGPPALPSAIGWPLGEVAALLAASAFYVGNDTGTANISAAVGTPTYCLFGAVPPFDHSSRVVPILPPGGVDKAHGMARITPEAVMLAIRTWQPGPRVPV